MKTGTARRLKWKIMKIKRKRVYEKICKIILVIVSLVLIYFILRGYLFKSCVHSVGSGTLLTIAFVLYYVIKPKGERMLMTLLLAVATILYWIFALVECSA